MDVLIRVTAIFIEVLILATITYCLFTGVRLTAFDLGLSLKYKKFISMALLAAGSIVVIFFIAHLASFYPGI